ncbi:pilus assembly protein TadG-related protein [Streptomyces rimosus]|uniref:pilus assembly protein TadG-related protein n=1 Tax=Streptomyces rimosus TaxID=1927 RepID=UPI000996D581|nr:pilus assembly protein TadG-related protein [Streptomyces rimosus]
MTRGASRRRARRAGPEGDARRARDSGQAFPVYIVAVAGLLFLALAFFAVGQAAAVRNSAQTAADAAALAAGQKYRDQLTTKLLDAVRTGAPWRDFLDGRGVPGDEACTNAQWFAGRNDADATCTPGSYPTSFAVQADTRKTVGRSVIPGTEGKHASARAKAVVEPRCAAGPQREPGPPGTGQDEGRGQGGDQGQSGGQGQNEDGDPPAGEPAPGDGPAPGPPLDLVCEHGKKWTIDPADPRGELPEASDLFSVRLAE